MTPVEKRRTLAGIVLAVLLVLEMVAPVSVRADGGTSDPDFDYLPPEPISAFEQFTSVITEFFRSPSHAGSYDTAKRRLYRQIKDPTTFYCGCKTNLAKSNFDRASCGYVPRNDTKKARRVEAEHILPAYWIAEFHIGGSCWEKDDTCGEARDCCRKNDKRFKKAHNDLVNLYPAIGELNLLRNDLMYDLISGENRIFGSCDFEVDWVRDVSEPTEDIRGDIARVFFYMRDTYSLKYPDDLADRLATWNDADPISEKERARNERIKAVQGAANPLLE